MEKYLHQSLKKKELLGIGEMTSDQGEHVG